MIKIASRHLVHVGVTRHPSDAMAYFNRERPHQGLRQQIPDPPEETVRQTGPMCVTPVLGGLHHS